MASEAQRRLQRSKQSERDLGHFLIEHNTQDPVWQHIATTAGRVGQIHDLQFDVVSLDYAAENKQVRVSKQILDWWDKIVLIAQKHDKQPLLRFVPTNEGKHAEMHVITAERHARLLEIEKDVRQGTR